MLTLDSRMPTGTPANDTVTLTDEARRTSRQRFRRDTTEASTRSRLTTIASHVSRALASTSSMLVFCACMSRASGRMISRSTSSSFALLSV